MTASRFGSLVLRLATRRYRAFVDGVISVGLRTLLREAEAEGTSPTSPPRDVHRVAAARPVPRSGASGNLSKEAS